GHVYSWGTFRSAEGIMGFSEATSVQATPLVINDIREPVVDVCAGVDHALALSASGKVYAWGYGQQGQLGRLIMERRQLHGLTPERIRLHDVKHIGCGSYHSFAVTGDGVVHAWGLNNFHQLGLAPADGGNAEIVYEPTPVATLRDRNIVKISGGEHHSIALAADGKLFSFGRSDSHQTGLPFATLVQDTQNLQLGSASQPTDGASAHKKAITLPTLIETIPQVADFASGTNHTLALTTDGHVYAWGYGEMLQLGNGEEEDVAQPLLLEGQKIAGKRVSKVAAGGQHSVILAAPLGASRSSTPASNKATASSNAAPPSTASASASSAPITSPAAASGGGLGSWGSMFKSALNQVETHLDRYLELPADSASPGGARTQTQTHTRLQANSQTNLRQPPRSSSSLSTPRARQPPAAAAAAATAATAAVPIPNSAPRQKQQLLREEGRSLSRSLSQASLSRSGPGLARSNSSRAAGDARETAGDDGLDASLLDAFG
ncbi:hypothetical protein LPJ57_009010, partial [Coemansia sp. RSA 486]